jgi:methanogenesis marker radical SAM protein
MEVAVDLGGRPGLDCGGFCKFCYFKGVKKIKATGCRNCDPLKLGCDYCSRAVLEIEPGFKPQDQILFEMARQNSGSRPDLIDIWSNGDLSCYPDLPRLVRRISGGEIPVFLDCTCGKGFVEGNEAEALIDAGVRRISISLFSTDPELRRKYVGDRHPEALLSNLRTFCERCDVYAMAVLIPGVNDGPVLEKTCQDLEEMGAKGLMLMIFANTLEQGLIFGNAPVMPGIIPHSVQELRSIATEANKRYSMRIIGTPLWDPDTGAPFAIAHNRRELKKLPRIEKSATLITGSLAYPLLSSIFRELGGDVNVLPVKKELASLMTLKDLEGLELEKTKERVIIPRMLLARDGEILKALRRDGKRRLVFRGPDELTVASERSIYMTRRQVLDKEIRAFTGLINEINDLGT